MLLRRLLRYLASVLFLETLLQQSRCFAVLLVFLLAHTCLFTYVLLLSLVIMQT